MSKNKILIVIILFIAIVLIYGFLINTNDIKVGDAYFSLPEGYECVANDKYANITNSHDSIIITNYDTDDVENITKDYEQYNMDHNLSVTISKLGYNNKTLYKSIMNNNSDIVHYWFVKDSNTYEIYTRSANPDVEKNILELIESAH